MNQQVIDLLVKQALRRVLTIGGTATSGLSDDWVTQTAGVLVALGNEVLQWWLAHRAAKKATA